MNNFQRSPVRNQQSDYRPDIDGVRALAVLAVVLFHAGIPWIKGGFVGVDIFFVISGLLIGSHVYSDIRAGIFSIAAFYAKRAKRILPALLALLAVCYIISLAILAPQELRSFGGYAMAALLSCSNILAWSRDNYFAATTDQNPLLMTWSLGVEEQFYLLFPVLMLLMARVRRKTIFLLVLLVAVSSFALSVVGTSRFLTATFYLLPTRAWEIAAGVLMAIYQRGRDPRTLYFGQRFADLASAIGLVFIAVSIFLYNSQTSFPGIAALLPVLGSVLLLGSPNSRINRVFLSSRPLTFIGRISYSLYLWHWPLLSFAHILSDRPLTVPMGCTIAAISVLPAWLSYKFVEQPFRKSKTPTRPLLLRYALVIVCFMIPGLVFAATHGLPHRFTALAAIDSSHNSDEPYCFGTESPNLSSACIDTKDPRPAIAIIGDSHANALTPALRQLAQANGYKTYVLTKASCPPLVGVARTMATLAEEQECVAYNANVLTLLENDPHVQKVIITAYWAGPEIDSVVYTRPTGKKSVDEQARAETYTNLEQGLEETIQSLQHAGRQVILVRDVPVFGFDPMRRIWSQYIPIRRLLASALFPNADAEGTAPLSETFTTQDTNAEKIITQVAQHQKVTLFDPKENLCSNGLCVYLQGVTPLYSDKQHLTFTGAKLALTGFLP
jgi:peptidoglycan/LPS O-acetylase OafA/YrhL